MILNNDGTSTYAIKLSPSKIGTQLLLKVRYKTETFTDWAVEDAFNGLTAIKSSNEPIFGFFLANSYVDLVLYKSGVLLKRIKNVKIEEGV
jgi:hypothetical protein